MSVHFALPNAAERARNRKDPNHVYVNMDGPRHRKAADFRPQSRQAPGPRVTVGWLKQRENYLFQHDTGRDHRFLLPANVSIRDIVRMFSTFSETIDGFLDKEDLEDFLRYVGIPLKSSREVYAAVNKVLGSESDGLIDQQEIQKFFLARPVFVPIRRDQDSRRCSRQGVRTSRNASREARRKAHATRRIVINPRTAPGGRGNRPFCNYKKYAKLDKKKEKQGQVVRLSGRFKGTWNSFPKYANLSQGVPYESQFDEEIRKHQEAKKRFVGGDFHVAVTAQVKRKEWKRIVQGGGIDHGEYVSPLEKERIAERERKSKFIHGGFHVV